MWKKSNLFLNVSLLFILFRSDSEVFARDGDGWWWKEDQETIAEHAQDVRPLSVGDEVAYGTLRTVDGKPVDLETYVHQKPTIVIFYQGGWSPYANSQLDQLVKIEPQLTGLGYQVAAITLDQPSKLAQSLDKHNIDFTLFSDRTTDVIRRFGLAYHADDGVLKKLGVRLREYTGNSGNVLPVPAVYGIDKKGIVQFVYFNWDYRFLLNSEKLLQAAKEAISENHKRIL
jgi:peroxiredoxin